MIIIEDTMKPDISAVIAVMSKSPGDRDEEEIRQLIPWMTRRSKLFKHTNKDVLCSLLQHCSHQCVPQDYVIIKQGDIGHNYFIILSGKASIYIDPVLSGEEPLDTDPPTSQKKDTGIMDVKDKDAGGGKVKNTRQQLGKHVGTYEAGDSFGELALLRNSAVRNASIIADEATDMLSIGRDLYNGTLKAAQVEDLQTKTCFVEAHDLFRMWSKDNRKLLVNSLKRITFLPGDPIVVQGKPLNGLHFMLEGQADVIVHPWLHASQFKDLFNKRDRLLMTELGRDSVSDSESSAVVKTNNRRLFTRRRGRAQSANTGSTKPRMPLRVASLTENSVIGDVELVLACSAYIQSVVCTSKCSLYHLENSHVERLITSRKTQKTNEHLHQLAFSKISQRRSHDPASVVEVFHVAFAILEYARNKKAEEEKNREKESIISGDPVAARNAHKKLLDLYLKNKAELVQPSVPDVIYYKEKALKRAIRKDLTGRPDESRFGMAEIPTPQANLRRAKTTSKRHARSRRELERLTNAQDDDEYSKLHVRNRAVNRFMSAGAASHGAASHDDVKRNIFLTEGDDSRRVDYVDSEEEAEAGRAIHDMEMMHWDKNRYRADVIKTAMEKTANQSSLVAMDRPRTAHVFERQEEDNEEFDQETSDETLRSIEKKLEVFMRKRDEEKGIPGSRAATPHKLKRFSIQSMGDVPVPGATVFVRYKPCKYPPGAAVSTTQHTHVRRFIVPANDVREVQKSLEELHQRGFLNPSSPEEKSPPVPSAPFVRPITAPVRRKESVVKFKPDPDTSRRSMSVYARPVTSYDANKTRRGSQLVN